MISRSLLLDFSDIHKHGKKNFRNDADEFLYFNRFIKLKNEDITINKDIIEDKIAPDPSI